MTACKNLFLAVLLCTHVVVTRSDAAADPVEEMIASIPIYRPAEQVSGVVRLWGHGSYKRNFMGNLLVRWTEEFMGLQPGVDFENRMYGTASAVGAVSVGAGEIALLGEEISPAATAEFHRARGYAPTEISVATGSVDVNFFDYAHMIFVHRDNPLTALTLPQLARIFGDETAEGLGKLRTWDQLGLAGDWSGRAIQPYGWQVDVDFALFFRERVLHDSHRWNPAVQEYVHGKYTDGSQYDHGQRIVDALAQDRYGIAISNVRYKNPAVKSLALAWRADSPAVAATKQTLISQEYPLVRIIPAIIDQPPGEPVDPAVREFLRYVLSRAGQRALIEETGYLPLGREAIAEQLRKLSGYEPKGAAGSPPVAGTRTEFTRAVLPPVHPTPSQTKEIRIQGSAALMAVAQRWAASFAEARPDVKITYAATGSDVSMAALYTGKVDLALLGREATEPEIKAFEWVFRYRPAWVEVMTGSWRVPGGSPALALYVSEQNPLSELTLGQVDAIFSPERRRGAPSALIHWGDLGVTGPWAQQSIRMYIPDAESGTGRFFRAVSLAEGRKLYWDRLVEFKDRSLLQNPSHDASPQVWSALQQDVHGLGVAQAGPPVAGLKQLRIAAGADTPAVAPTAAAISSRRYPLARPIYAYFNRVEGEAVDPTLHAFLQHVLSEAGQADIRADGNYFALPRQLAEAQRAALRR